MSMEIPWTILPRFGIVVAETIEHNEKRKTNLNILRETSMNDQKEYLSATEILKLSYSYYIWRLTSVVLKNW